MTDNRSTYEIALSPTTSCSDTVTLFSSFASTSPSRSFAMQFFTSFAVLAIALATVNVGAVEVETNAARMARGLPPKAPYKRGSPTWNAPQHKPSSSPNKCGEFLSECKRDGDCCWGPCVWGFCDL
ncbi:hypothetical protein FIBSPDRAFT_1045784 [Athelia psychrophila]|uniref:Uncharacterized protein n=1 Tax=Athelia psychrophila TaxID=1759441 RepID=A0A166HMR5_9AGAM|nr:hypothetical protein FIBSPDRAFT_1045784 [Fibularhizoctonia sp. CBS 109695]